MNARAALPAPGRIPRRVRKRGERGAAMITVMLVGVVLSSVVAVSVSNALSDLNRAASQLRRTTALQAAEAGIADYLAKLAEDHAYFAHYVHPAESTRTSGATVLGAGSAWTGGATWTYPASPNAWRSLPTVAGSNNGYEYNVQITPPTVASPSVRIVATGRKKNATREMRRLEVEVRPSSIADYVMLTNQSISYGSAATTRGKIYAGFNNAGVGQSVNHAGNAYASVYAEGAVRNTSLGLSNMAASQLHDGAREYDSTSSPSIRSGLPSPILFSTFVNSIADVRSAAAVAPGLLLDDAATHAWRLTFNADATVTVTRCTRSGTSNLAAVAPTCNTATQTTVPVPSNGAIYVEQSVMVRGVVDGQVTVFSNNDVVVGEDVSYELPGDDVLGLIAQNYLYIAQWATTNLNLSAAIIARSGGYQSWSNDGSHGTYTHNGAVATNLGGAMSMFTTRNYLYDSNLLFLQPPYWPGVGDAYVIVGYRELVPPA